MFKNFIWMCKCVFKVYKTLEMGDLEHTWYLRSGRYLASLYLLIINFTKPW